MGQKQEIKEVGKEERKRSKEKNEQSSSNS